MTCASSLHVSIFNQAGFRSLRNIFLPFLPEYLLRLVRLVRTNPGLHFIDGSLSSISLGVSMSFTQQDSDITPQRSSS